MNIRIIAQKGSHVLVACGDRFAIVEHRNGRFYNCHGSTRAGAGRLSRIDEIMDDADWLDEGAGWTTFNDVTSFGTELAAHMR